MACASVRSRSRCQPCCHQHGLHDLIRGHVLRNQLVQPHPDGNGNPIGIVIERTQAFDCERPFGPAAAQDVRADLLQPGAIQQNALAQADGDADISIMNVGPNIVVVLGLRVAMPGTVLGSQGDELGPDLGLVVSIRILHNFDRPHHQCCLMARDLDIDALLRRQRSEHSPPPGGLEKLRYASCARFHIELPHTQAILAVCVSIHS